jgi:peptidoglycan hydrolase-like protein with peptidoglycan-binding domain
LFNNKRTAAAPKSTLKPASQRAIDPNRATQIQSALIKSGYMSGTATGVWDSQTEAAMQKLQADNGWQTKIVPDARAIIKLGLGPNANSADGTPEASESQAAAAAYNVQ